MTAEAYFVLGANVTFIATGETTGGKFDAFEHYLAVGGQMPAQVNTREEEVFFIQEGLFEFMVGGVSSYVKPGDFVRVPPKSVYAFRNALQLPAKLLSQSYPAGAKAGFFREIGTPIKPYAREFIGPGYIDFEKTGLIAARWGITLHPHLAA